MDITEKREDLFDQIVEAKAENLKYKGGLEYNFALPKEIMITITLAEYRELVKNDADLSHERNIRYTAKANLKKAREEIDSLRKECEHLWFLRNTVKEASAEC